MAFAMVINSIWDNQCKQECKNKVRTRGDRRGREEETEREGKGRNEQRAAFILTFFFFRVFCHFSSLLLLLLLGCSIVKNATLIDFSAWEQYLFNVSLSLAQLNATATGVELTFGTNLG